MITFDKTDKKLIVPSSLGNFGNAGGGSGSGMTPAEVAEIASAVTEAAIEEYDTEIQVDLEEIRDAISGNTDTLLDLAVIAAMSVADRVALFDEVFEKASNGERIYIKGLVQEETVRTAVLPLVSYRPEANPVLHQGGNLYFAAKGDTDNIYFHIALTSEGSVDPTAGNIIKRNIYNLPTASAEVKGGVRIGSGLTMAQDVISVDTTGLVTDGDLAPFVAELSAATGDLAALSGSVNDIRSDVGTLSGTTSDILSDIEALSGITESVSGAVDTLSGITTATTDALSAATSALTENLEALSAVTSGLVSAQDIVYDYAVISSYTSAQKQALWNEISGYKNTNKKVWIRHQLQTEVKWYLCYKFDAPYIYFVANDNRKIYYLMFNQTGSFSNSEYVIQSAISAGSGVSISNNAVSLNIGEGLAFSGNTLVVSGISGGGGIEKVDTLPSTAEEGDIVWLNGHTETGFTFYESWSDWGATGTLGYVDGDEVYFDGERTIFGHWNGKIRFRRDADHLYADYLGGSSASVSDADGVNNNVEFPFIGSFYAFRNGMWTKVATDYVLYFDASDPVCKQVFLEIYEGLSDFDGSNLVIRYVQDSSWPYPREFRPYTARWYGVDCQSSDDRVSPGMEGNYGRISVDINRFSYDYTQDEMSFGTLVGTTYTARLQDIPSVPSFAFSRFGNDERGSLVYDADNGRFEYDNGYVTPGDTASYQADVVDYLFAKACVDGGLIFDFIYVIPVWKLYVISGGTTYSYANPTLRYNSITSTTIDDAEFSEEITFRYSDWELSMWMADGNRGANLRISAV